MKLNDIVMASTQDTKTVSYTHLDVYKRQALLSYARTGQFKDCRQCERFKGVYFRSDRVEGEKWFYSCVGRAVPVETHKAGDTYGGRK